MKKIYIAPAIKITVTEMQSLMLGSQGGGECDFAKGHDSFWDIWHDESEEDEEAPMFQQPKSLWD